MKKYFLTLAMVLISGCSTQPVPTNQANHVPPDRIWDKKIVQKMDNAGEILVKRDSGFIGSACLISIYIDGKPVADLNTREKVIFYPGIGRHVLSASPHGWCAGGIVESLAEVEINKPLVFRVGYGANGDFRFSPTAF
ncbi:hypothetical protein [Franconibacter helveticus]|uniref:hypothetical protein n=1 Tax=Franconibacter helveticus TaxID=357240 RepID=UPI000DA20AEB|nr:hypothetical protein [Franconibacter helveticus]